MEAEQANIQRPACPGCVERDRRIAALERRNAALEKRLGELERLVDQVRRGGKRQAAPFSKGSPKAEPKKPGRKGGDDYGTKAFRAAPPLDRIDEEHEAPLPDRCPHCGAADRDLRETHVAEQYQVDLPRRPVHRRFRVHFGRCACCGKGVRGRHDLQTSGALGAAASQLGPNLQAAVAHLNKHAGLSHGKTADLLQALWGVRVDRSGVCQAVLRAGRRCEGTYHKIIEHIHAAPAATSDETGWRIGGSNAWLHTASTPGATAYHIDRKRGYEAITHLIDPRYAGA